MTDTHDRGLPQYLNYRQFVEDGVLSLADGGFSLCYEYAGRDQEYLPHESLRIEAAHFNQDLLQLSNGWMLETHTVVVPEPIRLPAHHCPEPTSALVYEERAARYAVVPHYRRRHVMVLTYLPPAAVRQQFSAFMFDDAPVGQLPPRRKLLDAFIADVEAVTAALGRFLAMRKMSTSETAHFLHYCVTGEDRAIGIAEDGTDLHYAIGAAPMAPHAGVIGSPPHEIHRRLVGVIGYPGDGTVPQMFDPLLRMDMRMRMQHRFIALSTADAVTALKNKQADWLQLNAYNPKRFLWAILAPLNGQSADDQRVVSTNTDAENQWASVQREITDVQAGNVKLGYYTLCVVVDADDAETADANAGRVVTEINRLGFTAIVETDNAADADAGARPAHGAANIRSHFLNSHHLARLLPTSTPWTGEAEAPCPFYPPSSGPLLLVNSGAMPFALNLHAGDLANVAMIGPAGAGKSYAIGTLLMGFLQYPQAQVFVLDRDWAQYPVTMACGGVSYDMETLKYAPLGDIDDATEREWALTFVSACAKLRQFSMTPVAEADLRRALERLGGGRREFRTMTAFCAQLHTQQPGLKAALESYVGGLLDGVPGPAHDSYLQTYDMEKILKHGSDISTPVLLHVLHQMERRMDGRPTLVVIEECWQAKEDPILEAAIETASANYRKKNAALVLVLHSPKLTFHRADLLRANISTKMFLPNPEALSEGEGGLAEHYRGWGLGEREVRMVAQELRRREDYYLVKGEGRRVIQLANGPLAHAVLGVNGRDAKPHIMKLHAQHGTAWVPHWLTERKMPGLAARWWQRQQQGEAA